MSKTEKVERKTMSFEFEGSVLCIDDGTTVHRFDFDLIPEDLDGQFTQLGRKTKLANFAASAKSEGRDRIEMMQEGWKQLRDGIWEKEREGGGPTVSPAVEALAKLKGVTVAVMQKSLQAYDKATRAKILANPKVVELAAQIKEARGEKTVDLADLA